MFVSIVSILVNYIAAFGLIHYAGMGHGALALSTSSVAVFGFLALLALLRTRLGGIDGRAMLAQFLKVAAAATAMGIAVGISSHGMKNWLGLSQLARLADVVLGVPLGLTIFYFACKILGVREIDTVIGSFTNPVLRRLRRA